MKPSLRSNKGRVGIEVRNNRIRLNLPRAWFDGDQKRFALGLTDSLANRIKAEQEAKQNERHRRKRTVYHFAPLAHFVARFRSTAPFGRCVLRTQQAAGNQPEEIELDYLTNTFDSTLEKYKIRSEDKPKLTLVPENKPLTLLELWTEYQKYKQTTRKPTSQMTIEGYGRLVLKIKEVDCLDALRVGELLLSISTNHQVKRTLIELNAAVKWAIKRKLINNTQISPYVGMSSELPQYNYHSAIRDVIVNDGQIELSPLR